MRNVNHNTTNNFSSNISYFFLYSKVIVISITDLGNNICPKHSPLPDNSGLLR